MGPSWAGPENIRSSNILSTSATSMVTRNLKTLGIPLAPGLRPRFLDPVRLAEVPNVVQGGQEHPLFELLGRAPEHRPRFAGTSSDWEPSAFETRAESIGMCRKRSLETGWRRRRPASAAVCRIPCLILCLAHVERE